jgi:cytochrome P450
MRPRNGLVRKIPCITENCKEQSDVALVDPLIGKDNIVTVEGPIWKYLHKMLSPAFSTQHISNMRPAVSLQILFSSKPA